MMTRIAGNSGKRNGKPFRINAGTGNFYVILQEHWVIGESPNLRSDGESPLGYSMRRRCCRSVRILTFLFRLLSSCWATPLERPRQRGPGDITRQRTKLD